MKLLPWILSLMALCFLLGLVVQKCAANKPVEPTGRHAYKAVVGGPWMPDTVKRLRIKPIKPVGKVVVPVQTDIAILPDTAFRKVVEKREILIGVKHLPKPTRRQRRRARRIKTDTLLNTVDLVVIQTISPIGIIQTNQYPASWLQPGKWEITPQGLGIDSTALRKRKRLWK